MSTTRSGRTMTGAERAMTPDQAGLATPRRSRLGLESAAKGTEVESYGMPGRLPLARRSLCGGNWHSLRAVSLTTRATSARA